MDAERQNGTNNTKRKDYLEWNQYFMAVAFLSAQRSKDPRTQVGACIVNQENKIVGTGYNGMPIGCSDDVMPWGREDPDALNNKYLYVCHAELNAVMNKISADVRGCTIYVTLFPCNECAKIIIQAGIKEVIYFSDKNSSKVEFQASRRLMDTAGIPYRKFERCPKQIVIDLSQELPPQEQSPKEQSPQEQSPKEQSPQEQSPKEQPPKEQSPKELSPKELPTQEQPSQQSSGDLPSPKPLQEQHYQQDSHDLLSPEQLLQELTLQQSTRELPSQQPLSQQPS